MTDATPTRMTISKSEARASRGMVATKDVHATRAGLRMLESGGNAVDAAVAACFAVGVVEPESSGIGGGGYLVYQVGGQGRRRGFPDAGAARRPPRHVRTDRRGRGRQLRLARRRQQREPGRAAVDRDTRRRRGVVRGAPAVRQAAAERGARPRGVAGARRPLARLGEHLLVGAPFAPPLRVRRAAPHPDARRPAACGRRDHSFVPPATGACRRAGGRRTRGSAGVLHRRRRSRARVQHPRQRRHPLRAGPRGVPPVRLGGRAAVHLRRLHGARTAVRLRRNDLCDDAAPARRLRRALDGTQLARRAPRLHLQRAPRVR